MASGSVRSTPDRLFRFGALVGVFLGKTLYSHRLGVPLSTRYKLALANLILGDNSVTGLHPNQKGVEIIIVASESGDKLRCNGPLDSYADLTYGACSLYRMLFYHLVDDIILVLLPINISRYMN